MRHWIWIILGLSLVFSPIASGQNLRVMTYNIQHGQGVDGKVSLEESMAVIRAVDPDILLVNEVDVYWPRSGNVDQVSLLAKDLDYPYVYFAPTLPGAFWQRFTPRRYGNVLLSRLPLENPRSFLLPSLEEPRSLLVAEVTVDGETWHILGTHLGLSTRDRENQAAFIQQVAKDLSGPMVLLGDFNTHPDAPELSPLWTLFREGHELVGVGEGMTFPSSGPTSRIDQFYLSLELVPHLTRIYTYPSATSGHLPVVAEFSSLTDSRVALERTAPTRE